MLINLTNIPPHELGDVRALGLSEPRPYNPRRADLLRHPAIFEWRERGPVLNAECGDLDLIDLADRITADLAEEAADGEEIGILLRDHGLALAFSLVSFANANYPGVFRFYVPRWLRRGGRTVIVGWRELALEG